MVLCKLIYITGTCYHVISCSPSCLSAAIECLCLLKVSPQFDINNQTPAEQWSKKPRMAKRVKATDIFKSDPRRPQVQRERRTLGAMHNLKFHGDMTKICRHRRTMGGKHLARSKAEHCVTEVEDPVQKKQPFEGEQETAQSFSSQYVHGSSQNVMTDDVSGSFRPAFVSTPCAKKSSASCPKDTVLKNTTRPNCNMDVLIPDPSPNVFRWCDNVFGVQSVEHQSIRSTVVEKQLSPLKNPDPQSQDVDAMQASFEKLLFEQSDPDHTGSKSEDKSISILASNTPTHNGDYVMPYSRAST